MSPKKPAARASMSRRRFVTLVAAGSAALIASTSGAAESPLPGKRGVRKAPPIKRPVEAAVTPSELERQRGATADLLKTLRAHALPPGGEMSGAFRPVRAARKSGSR